MLKRIFWTIIIVSPTIAVGIMAALDNDNSASMIFNAGSALNYTWETITDFVGLVSNDSGITFWNFLGSLLLAILFVSPLVFVWRGLFIIEIVPLLGHALRIAAITVLIVLPGIFQIIYSNTGEFYEGVRKMSMYLEVILIVSALLGLWLPKAMTTIKTNNN